MALVTTCTFTARTLAKTLAGRISGGLPAICLLFVLCVLAGCATPQPVKVTTDPSEARIFLDGNFVGVSPVIFLERVKPFGWVYRLVATRPGYQAALREFPNASVRAIPEHVHLVLKKVGYTRQQKKRPVSGSGTGWMVGDHLIATAAHVVEGASNIKARFLNGFELKARVVAFDKQNDVAILKVLNPEGVPLPPAIPLAATPPEIGEEVLTIGYPIPSALGLQPKLANGVISSTSGVRDDPRFLQNSVPTQPGNSGGPLMTKRGEVVGLISFALNKEYFRKRANLQITDIHYSVKTGYLALLLNGLPGYRPQTPPSPRPVKSLKELARQWMPSIMMLRVKALRARD